MVTRDVLKTGINLPLVGSVSIVGIVAGATVLYFLINAKTRKIASKTVRINYRK